MVLSNKKLKQKLRASLAVSISESVAGTAPTKSATTNPESHSLKELLDSTTHKPRLSKREKRRNTFPLQDPGTNDENCKNIVVEEKLEGDSEGLIIGSDNGSKKKKKRKRDEETQSGVVGTEDDGDGPKANKTKKKQKKKKAKKKKKKKTNNEEEKNVVEQVEVETKQLGVAETIKITDSEANGVLATKVYVGGIPFYSTEDDIRSYFESCGTITEVDCMMFPESGKFRGIALISFKTEAAAKRALALDGSDMGGLFLKIQPYKATRANRTSIFAPEIVEGYNRIYIGNLSWDITEEDVKKFFSDCNIASIRFGMDKETGEFRGYAHVDFSDSVSMTLALKLDQEILCGRPVKISCAVPKRGSELTFPKKGSEHTIPKRESEDVSLKKEPAYVIPEKGTEHVILKKEWEPVIPKKGPEYTITTQDTESHSTTVVSAVSGNGGAVSGKIRRRTCYECGEKGHLSSACPNKLNPGPTDSVAS